MHRIHEAKYGSNEFNGSGRGNARFSPLANPDGTVIPTLYGAGTFRASAMETIFHDLPEDISSFLFPYKKLQIMAHSLVLPARDLVLLDLGSVSLRALRLKKTDVIETSAAMYWQTREFAHSWHSQFSEIDGLYWMSRQDDHSPACMLFGDRVAPDDLTVAVPGESLLTSPHLEEIVALAGILGINQGRNFPSKLVGF